MIWNWQTETWPDWEFDADALVEREQAFLLNAGGLVGAWAHLAAADQALTQVDLLVQEAMTSSAIEGEYLDRASVQSSVRRAFGMMAEARRGARESGIADLLADGFKGWDAALTDETLFRWHRYVCRGRDDLESIGDWRRGGDPMQVISGPYGRTNVHFEAPPAAEMDAQMAGFLEWFDGTRGQLGGLARAGLTHLYFVSIHPFEDGNGRIARALSEKALAQAVGHPSLIALSTRIEAERRAYYDQLEANNKRMEVTGWLDWFADIVLGAVEHSQATISHLIAKTHLMDRLRGQLNARQEKALTRLFAAGPGGFKGGLSAGNYISITGASPATAGRDLGELVEMGALVRTGERKGTRYWLEGQAPG
ncbi:Fic family protein [Aliiroseovarius sp.]|uniref:Fic family protein n=1 Tax=Aliiroseovarius sp. TaxID=1872442 RepID=UPI003BA843FE